MNYIFTLVLACMSLSISAQNEGMITFQEKVDVHRRLPEDRQEYKEMIPQFRTTNYELHYNENESSYKASKVQEEPSGPGSGGGSGRGMRMRMGGAADRNVYKNIEDNMLVDSREFMTKPFLIRGTLDEQQWKIADGQKQVLDYLCLKAVYTDSADTYIAWFTPQIPISNGPAEFAGLPGMILELDMNDGGRTITAVEVTEGEVAKDILKEPKKGKEVTSEEYREIVRRKMEEMRAERGGSGNGHMMIIRQ